MRDKLFPKNSFRRRIIKKVLVKIGLRARQSDYTRWAYERRDKIGLLNPVRLDNNPLISIVVPAFNTPTKYLYPLVYSVISQLYSNWELIIVDASSEQLANERISECKNLDNRIKVLTTKNKGISANTNYGVEHASGEYIAFMDHDDTITDDALYEIVKAINNNPELGLIYSDEDKVSDDGEEYLEPHFKPDWSPDLLTHVNYITHFVVVKKTLFNKVGGLDSKNDGAQDYDLLLKITDLNPSIHHVPKILYHWRIADNSTAQSVSNKPYIKNAGKRALSSHFSRVGVNASVNAFEDKPGFYEVRYIYDKKITLLFPPIANTELMKQYVTILYRQGYLANYHVLCSSDIKINDKNIQTINADDITDFFQKAQKLVKERVVVINDFVFPKSVEWAQELCGVLNEEHVDAVAPIICRALNIIEDAGLVMNGSELLYLYKGHRLGDATHFGNTAWTRNVDVLSGSVIALRSKDLADHFNTTGFANNESRSSGNVIWSNVVMERPRMMYRQAAGQYFNPSLYDTGSEMGLTVDECQMLDALRTIGSGLVS